MSHVATWQNFYVIIGSAGATLTGLMFVVMTLSARRQVRSLDEGLRIFNTPTIVHFSTVLFVATLLSAPWQALWQVGLLLCLCGLAGMAYVTRITRRMRRWTMYTPVLEDWLFHGVLPLASYTVLAIAAIVLQGIPVQALFLIGAATLLLLFIGIHNAWDIATFTITFPRPEDTGQDENHVSAVDGIGG